MKTKRISSQARYLLQKHHISVFITPRNGYFNFNVPGVKDDATSFELQDEIIHIEGGVETKFTKLIIEDGTLMLDTERHAAQQKQDNVAFKVVSVDDTVIAVTAQYKGKRYKGALLIDEE